jgi:predicted DNA-binding transcriptional regulator AlpA
MTEEKMLKVVHVAKRLDVSDKTIYRWIDAGIIFKPEKIKRINRSPRIPESEVNRVLSAGIEE